MSTSFLEMLLSQRLRLDIVKRQLEAKDSAC
nr:MAG TPA: hypothetical protein [Caudoviricetes sp.]DAW44749.1 MAG TPA: hypothetical protein [Caudoviricetes sp.]DAW76267.1 MAG TPA: hypothetical protein [Caudoviricetes sp.]